MTVESGSYPPPDKRRSNIFQAAVERNIAGVQIPQEAVPIIGGLGHSFALAFSISTLIDNDTTSISRSKGYLSILGILEQPRLIDTVQTFTLLSPDENIKKNIKKKRIHKKQPELPEETETQLLYMNKLAPYAQVVKRDIRGKVLEEEAVPIIAELGRNLHLQHMLLFGVEQSEYTWEYAAGILFVLNILEQQELVKLATQI